MKSYLYAVYDRLSNSFGALVEYRTCDAAISDFKKLFENGVTADPSQYELHHICTVNRGESERLVATLSVEAGESVLIYNYHTYLSQRLPVSEITNKLITLKDSDIDKVFEFVKSLKEGGNENGIK